MLRVAPRETTASAVSGGNLRNGPSASAAGAAIADGLVGEDASTHGGARGDASFATLAAAQQRQMAAALLATPMDSVESPPPFGAADASRHPARGLLGAFGVRAAPRQQQLRARRGITTTRQRELQSRRQLRRQSKAAGGGTTVAELMELESNGVVACFN
eukprot:TRINITY_DN33725_c0_g1_i1.p2 TRINITY_DN33725_c0_g1~~TRINITY_DN33725_c0_g1_i1.p2  ORF type:complete len:177 (-),score=33.31 TRINITY_DN33725_c0_g1_i1:205-684(-)